MVSIVVPTLGESVTSATIAKWFKQPGEAVKKDEPLVELETDKVTMEVNAPESGVLASIAAKEGDTVEIGAHLGEVDPNGQAAAASAPKAEAKPQDAPTSAVPSAGAVEGSGPPKEEKPVLHNTATAAQQQPTPQKEAESRNGPAADKMMAENPGVSPQATGRDGRITKGDVLEALSGGAKPAPASPAPVQAASAPPAASTASGPREERVKMTKLRAAIARRLKESQNTAAILTTFNDIDMSAVIGLRNEYKDAFEKKNGIKLGFMGFFVKAAVQALKEVPEVNAQIDGDTLIYKNYYDIGVAVGTESGLVVPVVRNADQLSLAGIEREIGELAKKARDGKLTMADMSGGTFTVSNGGVYGSLMSTPIINPPQSGILGMHRTEDRPVAIKGQVVVRPMMYVALSYDHRIIDGRESVTFLKRVKECVEDPRRLLLDI